MTLAKAVLFDFGQTLVDSAEGFRTAEKEAETEIFGNLNLESWPDFLANYRRFRQEFHSQSNFSRRVLWQAVYSHYGREPDQKSLLAAERNYWETVKSRTRHFPEAPAVLTQLASAYRLALITNSQGQPASEKHRLALFPELAASFEVIIVAGEAGLPPKPHPEPFLICLEKLGIAPAEAIYVGDDWRIDICGAQEVGIRPIWLQHHSVPRKWPSVETSVPVITGLEQLLAAILNVRRASRNRSRRIAKSAACGLDLAQ
jgi:HAD superfamily hydrolase (TIGR01549 family)